MDSLEKWLYNVPEPLTPTRRRTMKVLALGLSRSGTESLCRALRTLGYDHVYHGFDVIESSPMPYRSWTMLGRRKWGLKGTQGYTGLTREDFDKLLGHCEGVTDEPCALFAAELVKAYPEAKVILNHRDFNDWYWSNLNVSSKSPYSFTFLLNVLSWFNADLYWFMRFARECQDPFFYGSLPHHGKWVYEQHCAMVRGLVPPNQLLEWKVGDGWEPLCRFLEKEVPIQQFPYGNTRAMFQERFFRSMKRYMLLARRNMFISVFCLGVSVIYMASYLSQ